MGDELATWAIANPLAAIALFATMLGGLRSVVYAVGKAAPPVAEAIRAWKRRSGNGGAGSDDTGDMLKDLEGLGVPKPPRQQGAPFVISQPSDEMQIVKAQVLNLTAAVKELDRKVTGKDGLQERIVRVEQTCERTEIDVKALPERIGEQLREQDDRLAEARKTWRKEDLRDAAIGASRILLGMFRKQGILPDRRRGTGEPLPPHQERRKPEHQ